MGKVAGAAHRGTHGGAGGDSRAGDRVDLWRSLQHHVGRGVCVNRWDGAARDRAGSACSLRLSRHADGPVARLRERGDLRRRRRGAPATESVRGPGLRGRRARTVPPETRDAHPAIRRRLGVRVDPVRGGDPRANASVTPLACGAVRAERAVAPRIPRTAPRTPHAGTGVADVQDNAASPARCGQSRPVAGAARGADAAVSVFRCVRALDRGRGRRPGDGPVRGCALASAASRPPWTRPRPRP